LNQPGQDLSFRALQSIRSHVHTQGVYDEFRPSKCKIC